LHTFENGEAAKRCKSSGAHAKSDFKSEINVCCSDEHAEERANDNTADCALPRFPIAENGIFRNWSSESKVKVGKDGRSFIILKGFGFVPTNLNLVLKLVCESAVPFSPLTWVTGG
jgi:hypothetical protein